MNHPAALTRPKSILAVLLGRLQDALCWAAGAIAWCRVTTGSRFVVWQMLLDKYPPRPDVCVAVLAHAVDSFIIDPVELGSGSQRLTRCPLIVGEKGIHLANNEVPRCSVGQAFHRNFVFIPWSRLETMGDPRCLEVLGSGDRLLVSSLERELMFFSPGGMA